MPSDITMPQLSDTMTEGVVVKWHKKEGDAVKAGEEIADIETDKATMPMESFDSGVLAYIAASEGQKVKVGDLVAVIALGGENPEEVKKQAMSRSAAPAPPAQPAQTAVAPATEEPRSAAEPPAGSPPDEDKALSAAAAAAGAGDSAERVRATPVARRLAAEKGIDLSRISGSGPGGRVIERDVLEASAGGAATGRAGDARLSPGTKQVVPLTKMRSAIATALLRSKQTIPHFYETIDIDMERVEESRRTLNRRLEPENIRLSIADFVMRALAEALARHPALNARYNAEKGELVRYGDVNLGIAVAIPDGLIVPVLRGINRMGLREIRVRSLDLIERARAQRLRREEQTESTFTITSLGSAGVRQFAAIINPPEVGILAVGAAEKRPVVRDGQIVARTMMTVTLSADHRVVDGAVAAAFLVTLRELLEEPASLLL